MRTLAKTLEYFLVAGVVLAAAYAFIAPVARSVAASMEHSANVISNPGSVVNQ